MKSLFAGALALALQATAKSHDCYPSGYDQRPWIVVDNSAQSYNDVWYTIDFTERTWVDSVALCQTLGAGTYIASVFNDAETQAVTMLYDDDAWIGGYAAAPYTDWKWSFGLSAADEPISDYTNWEEGSPTDEPNPDYSQYMIRIDNTSGEWDDKGSPTREEVVICMYR